MNEKITKLQKLIDEASNIVFFGGAGVSTESGIRDFRSEEGLYKLKSKYGYPYEVMLSHSFYKKNPDMFFEFSWQQKTCWQNKIVLILSF